MEKYRAKNGQCSLSGRGMKDDPKIMVLSDRSVVAVRAGLVRALEEKQGVEI